MTVLLDTQVVLWILQDSPRLGQQARERILAAPAVHVSITSLWEMAIKAGLGKLEVPTDLPDRISASGLVWLDVSPQHAWGVQALEWDHRDPFDRMLLTQAAAENLILITADRTLLAAPGDVVRLDARAATTPTG